MHARIHLIRPIVALALVLLLFVVLFPAGQASAAPPSATIHTVRPGETLLGIATCYRVSPWAIAEANGLTNPNVIWAGQRLFIPGMMGKSVVPKIKPAVVPVNYNYYLKMAKEYAPLIKRYRTQYPGRWYTVCRGDTLWGIAGRYHTHPLVIAAANGLTSMDRIRSGQRLWIPTY